MNTQNTPLHVRLWNKDFWKLAVSDMFLSMSATMMLPTLPLFLMDTAGLSHEAVGAVMGAFALGVCLLGTFCSWLVQTYRRNQVFMWAALAMAVSSLLLLYDFSAVKDGVLWLAVLQRVLFAAFFGLAQMVLLSILIIDTCESVDRTAANYSSTWFSRFALSVGPLAGLLLMRHFGFDAVVAASALSAGVSILLIRLVDFPFRAPEENVSLFSLDRFFMPHAAVLFFNLLLVSTAVGMVLSMSLKIDFFAYMMAGFLLSLLASRFVFRDAELKSEIPSGLILLIAAMLVLLNYADSPVAPVFYGIGIGTVCSRFLLFFVKLSNHCQRGTSQSTYLLAWEMGLAVGIAIGYGYCYYDTSLLLYIAIGLLAVALVMYNVFTHNWFLSSKCR